MKEEMRETVVKCTPTWSCSCRGNWSCRKRGRGRGKKRWS